LDVPTELTLLDLNDVIQAAFSWDHSHLWRINIANTRYVDANLIDSGDDSLIDAAEVDLRALEKKEVRKFSYIYEFGDDWIHLISIYKRSPKPQPNLAYPALIASQRASPPEDVGEVWGYENFLEASQDPEHPSYDTFPD